jgi:two-component system, sensor histidine kinase and response regulator
MAANELRHPPQILIVEDDPSIKNLMEMIVKKEDRWQPTTVECGKNAVEAWHTGVFDVILMDLRMPSMDGIEATKKIREQEKRSGRKYTPIIAFTALVDDDTRQKCIEAGFDDFIIKPANLRNVIDTISKHLLASVREIRDVQ